MPSRLQYNIAKLLKTFGGKAMKKIKTQRSTYYLLKKYGKVYLSHNGASNEYLVEKINKLKIGIPFDVKVRKLDSFTMEPVDEVLHIKTSPVVYIS